MTKEEQRIVLEKEDGYVPNRDISKALLERYRYQSRAMMNAIRSYLNEKVGKGNYVAEKASIDEVFIDLTPYTNIAAKDLTLDLSKSALPKHAKCKYKSEKGGYASDGIDRKLVAAAIIADGIQQHVFAQVGLSLSAGISFSKVIAKFSASFNKPRGLTIQPKGGIPALMDETLIKDLRFLGGKTGDEWGENIPEGIVKTMGAFGRYCDGNLSVRQRDMLNGEDNDEVVGNDGCLVDSISSLKDFGVKTDYDPVDKVREVHKENDFFHSWLKLFAREVQTRVKNDTEMNNRRPKNLVFQYAKHIPGDSGFRSLTTAFPSKNRVMDIYNVALTIVAKKRDDIFPFNRFGLSASNFEETGDIESYFAPSGNSSAKNSNALNINGNGRFFQSSTTFAKKKSSKKDFFGKKSSKKREEDTKEKVGREKEESSTCIDEALAREIQRQFDEEDDKLAAAAAKEIDNSMQLASQLQKNDLISKSDDIDKDNSSNDARIAAEMQRQFDREEHKVTSALKISTPRKKAKTMKDFFGGNKRK